jgi:cyclopropane fatty-acyl-phospholipid synthase-like methyltransferase
MTDIQFSPAADRNKDPILAELHAVLPAAARVLEVASGTGQHAVHFAAAMPGLCWQPSDPDPQRRRSIEAAIVASGLTNLAPPLALDVVGDWPDLNVDAVYTANLLHISQPEALRGLIFGAASVLDSGGRLLIYGPFKRQGEHISPSNEEFDQSLRAQNPQWGIRDLEAVATAAIEAGFRAGNQVAMPANNFLLIFELLAQ